MKENVGFFLFFFLDFLSVCKRIFKVLPNGDRFSNVWQGELDELFICT